MEFSKAIISKELPPGILFEELYRIVGFLKDTEVGVKFGYAWQGEYEWKEMKVKAEEIRGLIRSAEKDEKGTFGSDDVHLMFNDYEIVFCHHGDIHLLFDKKNSVIERIVIGWVDKDRVNQSEIDEIHKD